MSTQRAEIEEELHFLNSLINAVGWPYFQEQLAVQVGSMVAMIGPPTAVEDFTMLGIFTHAGQIITTFPERLVARRDNLASILDDMIGDDDD